MCNLLKQLNDKFFAQSLNESIINISNIYGYELIYNAI